MKPREPKEGQTRPEAVAVIAAAATLATSAVAAAADDATKELAAAAAAAKVVVQEATNRALADFPRLQEDIREIRKTQGDVRNEMQTEMQTLGAQMRTGFDRINDSVVTVKNDLNTHGLQDVTVQGETKDEIKELGRRVGAIEKLHGAFKWMVRVAFVAAMTDLVAVLIDLFKVHYKP